MKKTITLAFAIAMCMAANGQSSLEIDVNDVKGQIPALIYGSGMEDVNHEIYGGLYDQRIFGESMEEPFTSEVDGFSQYDSDWNINGDTIEVHTSSHGKIVAQSPTLEKGTISVNVRLDGSQSIAGFIYNVSNASTGADSFNGYEVSLNADSKTVVVGRHRYNWSQFADVPADFNADEWNNLRVEFDGSSATIFLNDTQVYEFSDTTDPLTSGLVGLRSYGGSAAFYDFTINGDTVNYTPVATDVRNFRQYDDKWFVSDGVLATQAGHCAKIVYAGKILGEGSTEVEMRIDGDHAIAGFIFDVSEAVTGDDNFRGYEVSINASSHYLVIGKHNHNWEPRVSVPLENITPSDWNKLRIEFNGATFTIYINDVETYTYTDEYLPLMQGKIGLRTYDGPVSFRNFKINDNTIALEPNPVGVSGMWDAVGNGTYTYESTGAFHGSHAQTITGKQGDGICNFSLNKWGIGVNQGETMKGFVYLKGNVAGAYVALQNADGSVEYARQNITGITTEWQKFEFELTPSATDAEARFVIALDAEGTMTADMVMLHTDSYPYRKDLTEAFQKENLTFLRYGGSMVNASGYMTGNMLGDVDKRPPYTGYWYPYSTNGFGIKEFVEFARKIGAEPTFAINIEDNPDDVLKLLEEIEDLNLGYIEIGNEENITTDARDSYVHYVERFLTFYNAIHPVYPNLQFINAAWWRSDNLDLMKYVFQSLDGKASLWDFHPWTETVQQAVQVESDLKTMQENFLSWNPQTEMRVAILEENGNIHNMQRALSHAVVLNVVRKMDGFVQLDSPANALQPYLQNDNGWDQGQIFFNSSEVWCQPPYYVQQVAAAHHQPTLISSTCDNSNLNITATRNTSGDSIVVHVVNTSNTSQSVKLSLTNNEFISAKMISVSGNLDDKNTPQSPELIVPQESEISGDEVTLAPYSYNMIEIKATVPTDINDVTTDDNTKGDEVYYNLAGQLTNTQSHGIYISKSGTKIVK